jgi:hypothetical protein
MQTIQRHLQAEVDSSAVPPCELPQAAAQHFAASLPEGLLPANWWACTSWQQLDRALSFANHGVLPSELKRRYKEAKAELQGLCAAAHKATIEQQQQQQQQQPRLAAAHRLSGSSAWDDTSSVLEASDSKAATDASRPTRVGAAAGAVAAAAPQTPTEAVAAAAAGPKPGSAAWAAALQALLSRQGCTGKEADVNGASFCLMAIGQGRLAVLTCRPGCCMAGHQRASPSSRWLLIIIIPCKPYLSASATAPHPLGRRKVERLFSLFSV